MLIPTLLAIVPSVATSLPEATSPTTPTPTAPLQEEEAEERAWSGAVTVGATINSGNDNTRSGTATADATWQSDPNRVTLGLLWNYQEQDVVLQRRLYGAAQYDRFFDEKTYGFGQTTGEYDLQANLDLRWTAGLGVGRQFRDDEKMNLSGELGISYVGEEFRSGAKNEYPAARAAYSFGYRKEKTWEFTNEGQIFPSLENGDDVWARMDTRFKMSLTEAMFTQIQWVLNWDNTPDTGKKRTDHIVALTIGWGF